MRRADTRPHVRPAVIQAGLVISADGEERKVSRERVPEAFERDRGLRIASRIQCGGDVAVEQQPRNLRLCGGKTIPIEFGYDAGKKGRIRKSAPHELSYGIVHLDDTIAAQRADIPSAGAKTAAEALAHIRGRDDARGIASS